MATAYLLASARLDSYNTVTFGAIASAALTSSTSPLGLAISPDNTRIYTTDANNGEINVIDVGTFTVIDAFALPPGTGLFACTVTPDNAHLLVTSRPTNELFIIETVTFTTVATLLGFNGPFGVSVHPDGNTAYVCDELGGDLAIVDITTITAPSITTTVSVGTDPTNNVITPDGSQVYTANVGSNNATAVDTTTLAPTTISVGTGPVSLCVLPNGLFVYVANSSAATVSVIDTGTNTVSTTVTLGANSDGIAPTPDSLFVWAAEPTPTDNIDVVTVASNTVTHTISAGVSYSNIVMTPAAVVAASEFIVLIV